MADVFDNSDDMYDKLRNGKNIMCPKCQKAPLKPFPENIAPNKSYSFYCSNDECDWFVRYEPIINIK